MTTFANRMNLDTAGGPRRSMNYRSRHAVSKEPAG
jgi:hypothetical protein